MAYLAQFFALILILDFVSSFKTPKSLNWYIFHHDFFKALLMDLLMLIQLQAFIELLS